MPDSAVPSAVVPDAGDIVIEPATPSSGVVIPGNADWFKDAVFYELHVKAFADGNGDGIGDFKGLTERLDYLQDLGITCIWLLPFYPSPQRDDGYDISDYRSINPAYGTMRDFRLFMDEAKRRGLRVITELVINHTSDQHPWFQRARAAKKGSKYRDWYVWSDTDQKYQETRIIFTDTEKSNWTWDPVAGAYYWHRFFSHQPDLNYDNPQVFRAIVQTMKFWLDFGIDGFRLDAIPYLIERDGTINENLAETHTVIKALRRELDAYAPGRLFLAEANMWPEDVSAYFGEGDGDECHMAYHFPLMPRMFMAIAQEDRHPITDIMRQTPDIPANCQWAMFLRNHDELTLEMVTDMERDYLWSTYAADKAARINVGIRRRLAPLMDNDRRKIELMNSLLFSMPGTPFLYYGDEIGMGDNFYLGDRNGVRTPMQWTPDRNGGFSRCDPARLYLPAIMDPVYGFQSVNVEAQSRSVSSLLSWTKRIIAVRKTMNVFGRGSLSFLYPANRSVFAYLRIHEDTIVLCVANLSRAAQAAQLDLSAYRGRVPVELLGRTAFPTIGDAPFVVTLQPYGFFWFHLTVPEGGMAEAPAPRADLVTLVMSDGWRALREGRSRQMVERDILPAYVCNRRWYAAKSGTMPTVDMQAVLPLAQGSPGPALAVIETKAGEATARYALPLDIEWSRLDLQPNPPNTVISRVRKGPKEGVLVDAAGDPRFVTTALRLLLDGAEVETGHGRLVFSPTQRFQEQGLPAFEVIRAIGVEQSNSTTIVDDTLVMKTYRRLQPGINPEIEIGRFLTDVAQFAHVPPLLGSIEWVEGDARTAVGVVHGYVWNQGDGWTLTANHLDRVLEEMLLVTAEPVPPEVMHAAYLPRAQQLGLRTAELHLAMGSAHGDAALEPEPITPDDIAAWTEALVGELEHACSALDALGPRLSPMAHDLAQRLLAGRDQAIARARAMLPRELPALKARHHGDYHLGQVMIVQADIAIVDFEGEPMQPIAKRREKAPVARDVAGMLRSFDYAGWAALDRVVQRFPEAREPLTPQVEQWRGMIEQAFLGIYRETVGDSALWPQEPDLANRLLAFFILEKAVHEIHYELNNRPDWVHLPLAGIVRILLGDGVTS